MNGAWSAFKLSIDLQCKELCACMRFHDKIRKTVTENSQLVKIPFGVTTKQSVSVRRRVGIARPARSSTCRTMNWYLVHDLTRNDRQAQTPEALQMETHTGTRIYTASQPTRPTPPRETCTSPSYADCFIQLRRCCLP